MSFLGSIFEEEKKRAEPRAIITGPILAVDVGSVHTRAVLLDLVEGKYRFVGRAQVPTTASEPFNNIFEGVHQVISTLSETTGRHLLNLEGHLIIPEEAEFVGVDLFVATASAGRPIRAVLLGLMPNISLASGRRAADSIYLSLSEVMGLDDRRSIEQQVDALLGAEADLVLVVGGTDNGAVESLLRRFDTIALAYSLMDNLSRPPLLYAGNRELAPEIVKRGEEVGIHVLTADNVRPTLNEEYLDSAQRELARLYHRQKSMNTPGFADLGGWTEHGVYPTTHGFGRMIHLMGGLSEHNILGIDLGSTSTSVAAYIDDQRYLNVFGHLGMGHSAQQTMKHLRPEMLARWLTHDVSEETIRDYVWNKALYPHIVPATPQALELEYALAREIVRAAALSARKSWRDVPSYGLLPHFSQIILSGAVLTLAPDYGWSALAALDALQPVGITRLLLDPYGMAAALGTIAPSSPEAVVQVLESGAFLDLGTVINVSGHARHGEVVLHASLKPEGESRPETYEVRFGDITTLPLEHGRLAELVLQPRRGEIAGVRRRQRMRITGGALGVIVDARGRPWRFPRSNDRRQAALLRWQESLIEERMR